MAKGKRRWMVAAIRKHLLPALHEIGFETVPLTDEENQGQIRQSCPFGRLRRARSGDFDLVEVLMHKHGEPAFKMRAGTVTPAGITHFAVGYIPADQVWASYLSDGYEIFQVPWLMKHFRVERWPWQDVTEQDVDKFVAKIAKFVPREIDEAVVSGRIGRHVRKWG